MIRRLSQLSQKEGANSFLSMNQINEPDSCAAAISSGGIFKLVLFDEFACAHPFQGQYTLWVGEYDLHLTICQFLNYGMLLPL